MPAGAPPSFRLSLARSAQLWARSWDTIMVANRTQPETGLPPRGGRFDPESERVASVGLRVRELIEFASYYLAAQADRLKLTAINVAMFAVLAAVVAFIGIAVVLTAGVVLVLGVAGALGALCGGHLWVGELITSAVILGAILVGVVVGFKAVLSMSRKKVVETYEQRKSRQRADLGTDVDEEAER